MPIIPWMGAGVTETPTQSIVGTEGIDIAVTFGETGGIGGPQDIIGAAGIDVDLAFGDGGAFLHATGRAANIFIAGVDRSAWIKIGIRRSMTLSGGSKATCELVVVNEPSRRSTYRPEVGDEVILYERGTKFFAGLIDTTEEYDYTGTSALNEITCRCVDYGALCDRRIIGWHYELWAGALATNIMDAIAVAKLADFGVRLAGATVNDNIGIQTYNWVTVTEAYNSIAQMVNGTWRIDFDKNLWLLSADGSSGYAAAPFNIAQNDGNWAEMRVERSASRKVNRQGVRNSQDLQVLWTDSFTGDGAQTIFVTMAQLKFKPIVRVDGVDQVVVGEGETSGTWDFLWEPFSVFAHVAPAADAVIEVLYPSPLSHVEWAEDTADIAANGLYEAVEELKDLPTTEAMQLAAQALLEQRTAPPVSVTYVTREPGLDIGMSQTIDTARPLCSADMVIQQIDSEEEGKARFFRHVVRASTARIPTNAEVWAKIQAKLRQPTDRILQRIHYELAGTIEGLDNPGLTTGVKPGAAQVTSSGVVREVDFYFATGSTTEVCEIDIFKNGVSIFAGSKPQWPIGGQDTAVVFFAFAEVPLLAVKGDLFTFEITEADPAAKDGWAEVVIVG
jgi:hypothetical protein